MKVGRKELSVIASNTYEPVIEKVNLCEVVCEEILANYPGFEKKGITPVFEQAEECAWVQADRQLLLRVIQNLISNCKFFCYKRRKSVSNYYQFCFKRDKCRKNI